MLSLKKAFLTLFALLVAGVLTTSAVHSEDAGEIRVDSLEQSQAGHFPALWKTYPFYMGKAESVYRVAEEGGDKFIRAVDERDISVPIIKNFHWPIEEYPYLKFRWRARKLPAGAKENSYATNDSACAVYVGYGKTTGMKYVWSTSFPVGSYWGKTPGKFYIISKEMGPQHLNQWQEVSIPVIKDYQKYFGTTQVRRPSGIALMTDGNAVHQPAACDYTNLRISKTP